MSVKTWTYGGFLGGMSPRLPYWRSSRGTTAAAGPWGSMFKASSLMR
ncbi:MAG: hypothetical protein PHF84_07065 [bacterium]|nr:hypothetical protein [bacterium]